MDQWGFLAARLAPTLVRDYLKRISQEVAERDAQEPLLHMWTYIPAYMLDLHNIYTPYHTQ